MPATFKTCTARALFIPSLPCLFLARTLSSPSPHLAVVLTFRNSDHQIVCRNILHGKCAEPFPPTNLSNTVRYLFFLQKFLFLIFSSKEQRSSGHAEDILVSFSFIFADKSRWNVIRCLDIVRFDCSHWIHGSFLNGVLKTRHRSKRVFEKYT